MKNIDQELIEWAIDRIQSKYPDDIALLVGQYGACKTPEDEQKMAFDFFIPSTERGNQLSQTFVIEDMGYDLYPISWKRLQGIVDLKEPRMIFAFMKGEVIYAKDEEEKKHYYDMKQELLKNLEDPQITFPKALESLNTAMEIYQTMMFEDSLCAVRKAAGGVSCFLMNAIAMVNGQYLKNGYGNLTLEIERMHSVPDKFAETYDDIIHATTIKELQEFSHSLIKMTRDYFIAKKPQSNKNELSKEQIDYDNLADWYQEARYTFRRIEYFAKKKSVENCFLLGCYIQIEFDAIQKEFELKDMDLLGVFDANNLEQFAMRAKELEEYIIEVLEKHHAALKIYDCLEEFLEESK